MIDLRDTTFLIPVKYDSNDRIENLLIILRWIFRNFEAKIIIAECVVQGQQKYCRTDIALIGFDVIYRIYMDDKFHRTKLLNEMAKEANTKVIVLMDSDVIIDPPESIKELQDKIIRGETHIGNPFNSLNHCVQRNEKMRRYFETLDMTDLRACDILQKGRPSGGIVMCNRETFWKVGGENENYVSYAAEDAERVIRWEKLGYPFCKMPGTLYHLEHHRGLDSGPRHENMKRNNEIFERNKNFTREQWEKEIATWEWCK